MYDGDRSRSRKLQPHPEAAEAGRWVYCGVLALWLATALFAAVMLLLFFGGSGGGEQGGGGAGHDDTDRNGGASMSSSISAVDLPYVGRKYQLEAESGDRLTVVRHRDGRRDLYHSTREDPDRVASVVRLQDGGEARQLAGIVGGLIDDLPEALPPPAEVALGDSVLRWVTIAPGWGCVGEAVPERATRAVGGAHLVARVEEGRQALLKLGPGIRLREGMTLMVVGDRERVEAFEGFLRRGGRGE